MKIFFLILSDQFVWQLCAIVVRCEQNVPEILALSRTTSIPNLVQIYKMKELLIQELGFDRSVCMTAVC